MFNLLPQEQGVLDDQLSVNLDVLTLIGAYPDYLVFKDGFFASLHSEAFIDDDLLSGIGRLESIALRPLVPDWHRWVGAIDETKDILALKS